MVESRGNCREVFCSNLDLPCGSSAILVVAVVVAFATALRFCGRRGLSWLVLVAGVAVVMACVAVVVACHVFVLFGSCCWCCCCHGMLVLLLSRHELLVLQF